MQKMQNGQILMESNSVKTKMSSSGTSLAFHRAKEHPNRSSGVEVMAENVKWTQPILGGPCARGPRPVDTGSRARGTRTEDTGSPKTSRGPVGTGQAENS